MNYLDDWRRKIEFGKVQNCIHCASSMASSGSSVGAQKTCRSAMTETLMKTYRIAAIPGDGIGTEVVSAGIEVLHALAKREAPFQFKVCHFDWGGEYYKKNGRMMPEDGRSLI